MSFNIHKARSLRFENTENLPVAQSQQVVVQTENLTGKISEIKEIVQGLSERLGENIDGITGIVEEQDKEIDSTKDMLAKIENQMKSLCNELAHYNTTKEEHEILIKELVKESKARDYEV